MPYWRLSAVYFAYFFVVGATSPYWGLYLQSLGYRPQDIGILAAIPSLTKLVAPNAWSWFSDRSGKRLLVMRLGALGACVCFLGVFFQQDFFELAVILVAYSIFWNAVLPQFEALTLRHIDKQGANYSRVRVWGSVGFIFSVLGPGWFFEFLEIGFLPWAILLGLISIFGFACTVPEAPIRPHEKHSSHFLTTLLQPHIIAFFVALFFLQASHGVYYVFYSIFLESFGYSKSVIGIFWTVGVLAEIFIFWRMPALLSGFARYHLLVFSFFAAAARWVLVAFFPEHPPLMIFAQFLHALTFGVVHAVAIDYIKNTFPDSMQGQAQALYSAFTYGGGAAMGAYVSGFIWNLSPHFSFLFAASAASLSFLITFFFLRGKL